MSWIVIVALGVVVVGVGIGIVVYFASRNGNGGDTIQCPHCHKSVREPARRRSSRGIDLYDFPCPKCRETIYVKA